MDILGGGMRGIDVLIVTGLKDEYEAARAACVTGYAGHPGVSSWDERDRETPTPYLLGDYVLRDGGRFSVALARPTRMGGTATGPVVASLVERLKPTCLAMCGVCAGNPRDVVLGDVVVAEMTYAYDEGKRTQDDVEADHRQYPMPDTWVREAQDLSPVDLPSFGEPTVEEAKNWLLERLYAGDDPQMHIAHSRYFSRNTWNESVESLRATGMLTRGSRAINLTKKGRAFVERLHLDGPPKRLPFKVEVGPIASGNVVVKDGLTWEQLKKWGMRTVVGLEMEAATIGSTAHRLGVPNWAVVKGVMDHADPRKDDRYKQFAARASAEVLLKLVARRLVSGVVRSTPDVHPVSRLRSVYVIGGITGETPFHGFEKAELLHVCRLLGDAIARSGAELVVCSPFPDSADAQTVIGYVESQTGRAVHFHSPRHPEVEEKREALLTMLGKTPTRILNWFYPSPEDENSWEQAWLLCQLQALEKADAVIAVGGRVSDTANTLLHLAEARQIPIVPFSFLGGAAGRAYARRDWTTQYPGLDHAMLREKSGVGQAMTMANHLVTARLDGNLHYYRWPPETIFVSRARKDAEYARKLVDYLLSSGRTALLGDNEVSANKMVESSIDEAILRSDLFVALWSSAFGLSRFCNDELDVALQRHRTGEMQIWILNIDGTEVVPRGARRIPQAVARTPETAVEIVRELLDSTPALG